MKASVSPSLSALLQVPAANRATIEYLVRFLSQVAKSEKVNRMGIPNLAIIFAPSMLRDPSGDPMSMMRNTQYESGCVFRACYAVKNGQYESGCVFTGIGANSLIELVHI